MCGGFPAVGMAGRQGISIACCVTGAAAARARSTALSSKRG